MSYLPPLKGPMFLFEQFTTTPPKEYGPIKLRVAFKHHAKIRPKNRRSRLKA
jgi:hypothetical protein